MIHSTELRRRLEAGIHELEGDIAKLRAAISALDAGGSQTPPTTRPPRRSDPAATPTPRYDVVPAGKLASLLSSPEGLPTADLAQQTNGDPAQVLELLKELEQNGQAHRSGRRRSTRWHAGTPAAETPIAGTPIAETPVAEPPAGAQADAVAAD